VTLPLTAEKFAAKPGRLGAAEEDDPVDGEPEPEFEPELEPPPHAVMPIAMTARPVTQPASRRTSPKPEEIVMSLTSQCVDRSEPSGSRCRVDPKADPDRDRNCDRTDGGDGRD
jgi:hypothetical protein